MALDLQPLRGEESTRYYQRTVSSGDQLRPRGVSLPDAQAIGGTPPGVWMGRGAVELGVSGQVSEEQMHALFALGLHPDAHRLAAERVEAGESPREALRALQLGYTPPKYSGGPGPLERRINAAIEEAQHLAGAEPLSGKERVRIRMRVAARAFREDYGRNPADGQEIGRYLAAAVKRSNREPVFGYDLVFRSKSVSLLWGLADEQTRLEIEAAHEQAIAETLAWLEENALAVRTGAGGVAQQDAKPALIVARYRHFDNRHGLPLLHDHAVVANKIQGLDGKWRSLDGRLWFRQIVTASELYNRRVIEEACARLGLRATEVAPTPGRRPVLQIAGIPQKLIRGMSTRDTDIRARLEELIADRELRTGRSVSVTTRMKLLSQASRETRPPKKQARPLSLLRTQWRSQAIDLIGEEAVDNLLATAREHAQNTPIVEVDLDQEAATVVKTVGEHRAVFGRRHLAAESQRHLARLLAGTTAPPGLAEALTHKALTLCLDLTPPEFHTLHPALLRADGTSIYRPRESETYTTPAIFAAEDALLAAARTPVIPPVDAATFNAVVARHGSGLDAGQLALTKAFACGEQLLIAGIGPAGSGKTTALSIVTRAVEAAGSRLIALAPSRRAAQVLSTKLATPAHTLHGWMIMREKAADGEDVPPDYQLRPGDVVVIDEAAMAGTVLLQHVLDNARAAGAHVRLLGDPAQLTAVEAGGVLRLLAREVGAVHLSTLHRFNEAAPGEAEATLALRDGPAPAAFTWYLQHNRLLGGDQDAMLHAVFAAWQHDVDAGRSCVMTAENTDTVTALNARAQAYLAAAGRLDPSRARPLRDGLSAYVGDLVVTRDNARHLMTHGTKDFVKNGDVWHLEAILADGDLLVRHSEHRGRIRLPSAYVNTSVDLGYAATVHRSQGITVETSHGLATARTSREAAYVQLTRGMRTNRLYVVCEPGVPLEQTVGQIAENTRAALSAHDTLRTLQEAASAPHRLATEFTDASQKALEDMLKNQVRHAAGGLGTMFVTADGWPILARTLTRAHTRGWDIRRLIDQAFFQRDFADADDAAVVMAWRIDHLLERARNKANHARRTTPRHPLADLSIEQLHHLAQQARAHKTRALDQVAAADAAVASQPKPITVDGLPHPAWPHRPFGDATWGDLYRALARARTETTLAHTPLHARASSAEETAFRAEIALRMAMPWRIRAREDWQRERGPLAPHTAYQPAAVTRAELTGNRLRAEQARDRLHRARVIEARIDAELRLRTWLPDRTPTEPDDSGPLPDWLADSRILTEPHLDPTWHTHLTERHRMIATALTHRGFVLAASPPPWTRPLGPLPPLGHRLRPLWENTAALTEAWRQRRRIPGTLEGIGERPTTPRDAAAWDELSTRIRALSRRTHATAQAHARADDPDTFVRAAHRRLDAAAAHRPPPHQPVPIDPLGVAPLLWETVAAQQAAGALAELMTTGQAPEPWMDHIPAPDPDDEDQQLLWTRLTHQVIGWRKRRHRAGTDPLGPRPLDDAATEWDHLNDALNHYRHLRITQRLAPLTRTAGKRTDPAPAPHSQHSPTPDPPSQPGTPRRP
ncbi:MobF family relaxase [Streptomyces sp. NPDC020883]|uniref:MobF family relaxase n=1 Tax=Streptomyces sp. NPDC020883 TaxID=3365099 RepID=UPI0037992E04